VSLSPHLTFAYTRSEKYDHASPPRGRFLREVCVGDLAIHTRELTKTFGPLCAVDRVNLAIPTGALYGLLGANGSGKTTIIRLLLGLLVPSDGEAWVLGYATRDQGDRIRHNTGALFADTGLYARLTALENLDYYGRIWHMSSADRRSRSRELLSRLALWELRDRPAGQLDALNKRRLSLARALFHRPALLFADDPTERLDRDAADEFRADITRLVTHEGVTLLLASRSLAEVEALCTSVAVLRHGRIIADGPIHKFRRPTPTLEIVGRGFDPQVITLFSRRSEVVQVKQLDNRLLVQLGGDYDTAPLVSLLVESGADVEEVRKLPAGLESVLANLLQEET
jgi:ABC-type multidrug transport system ATPase subunit